MNNDNSSQGGSLFDRPNNRPQVSDGSRRVPIQIDSVARPGAVNQPPNQGQPGQPSPNIPSPPPQTPNFDFVPPSAPSQPPSPLQQPEQPQPTPQQPYPGQYQPQPQPMQPQQNPSYQQPAQQYPAQAPANQDPNADSLYADASRDIDNLDKPAPTPAHTPLLKKKETGIVKAIKIFGGTMTVLGVISLITWIMSGVKTTEETVGFVLAVGEIILGVGIILRLSLARTIFIILAALMLVFSVYATFGYLSERGKYNNTNSSQIIGLQAAISKYQNDNSISAAQRAKYISVLTTSEGVVRQQMYKIKVPLTTVVFEYVISIVPLVFLTRPKVRQAFIKTR